MRPISRRMAATAIALLAVVLAVAPSQAQSWPTRPVKFIVPFGPGAGADIGARLFAERLTKIWGQPVVVENRPGGNSLVAINAFLSANDDHVLLFGPSGNFTVHPFIYAKLPYDPTDLIPIVQVSNTILAVAVKADAPYGDVKAIHRSGAQGTRQVQFGSGPGHHRVHVLGLHPPREAGHRASAVPRHQSGARSISAKAASRW